MLLKNLRLFASSKNVRASVIRNQLYMLNSGRCLSYPSHTVVPMPALSPTMEAGSIAKWCIKEGDKFEPGVAICEVETDKATVTFDATDEGYLAKILVGTGEIKVGQPIMVTVEDKDSVSAFSSFSISSSSPSIAVPAQPKNNNSTPDAKTVTPNTNHSVSVETVKNTAGSRIFASPLARKIARESGIDLSFVAGTGPNGRILSADVALASTKPSVKSTKSTQSFQTPQQISHIPSSNSIYQDFELSDLSQALANRFTSAKQNVPHYYLSVDLNLSKLLDLRAQMLTSDPKNSISVLDMLIKAVGIATKQVPDINGSWMNTFIRRYDQVDINIVMGTGSSVVTPVIRDVNSKGLHAISCEMASFEDTLVNGNGSIDESKVAIGTISIHNLGIYGIKSAAPIVLPPQAASLAFGAIVDSVVPHLNAKDGQDNWTIAPTMVTTLSCDHRVFDGAVGAQWLAAFKLVVENPAALLL